MCAKMAARSSSSNPVINDNQEEKSLAHMLDSFLSLFLVGSGGRLPQEESCRISQLTCQIKQGGRRIVQGDVGVTPAGCYQCSAIVNQGTQVTIKQGLVKPCNQGSWLGVLEPIIATSIHCQVMVAAQSQHHIGKLAAQVFTTLTSQIVLLNGKELTMALLRHLHRQEVNDPVRGRQ